MGRHLDKTASQGSDSGGAPASVLMLAAVGCETPFNNRRCSDRRSHSPLTPT